MRTTLCLSVRCTLTSAQCTPSCSMLLPLQHGQRQGGTALAAAIRAAAPPMCSTSTALSPLDCWLIHAGGVLGTRVSTKKRPIASWQPVPNVRGVRHTQHHTQNAIGALSVTFHKQSQPLKP